MYKTSHYRENDREVLVAFMKENYFAVLTANTNDYPVATHIPLEINIDGDKIILGGHMMKGSDHYRHMRNHPNVLVIFNGPHCYVSASWYAEEPMASTWDYMTVHANGTIQFKSEEDTIAAVKRITNEHEAPGNHASLSRLPEGYIEKLAPAIIAFEIEVQSLENVFKLSQNRSTESKQNIAAKLREIGTDNTKAIADEILKRL